MSLLDVTVENEDGTRRLAEDLAMVLRPGDVVALSGDLGMGKSAFARALIRCLADDDGLEVPSPTFTLVQTYDLPGLAVSHFDLYRLADAGELDEIGFDAAVRDGVVLVEWPDRAAGRLPADTLSITLTEGASADARVFAFDGPATAWAGRLARTRAIRALLAAPGTPPAARRRMAGDASSRRFERVRRGGDRLVVMDWPRRGPQPPLADGLSYPELVHVQDDALSFVAVSQALRQAGLVAPGLHAVDRAAGLLVVDDLGTGSLLEDGRPVADRFLAAAEALAAKDAAPFPDRVDVPGLGSWRIPPFDPRALLTELSLLPDWYVPLMTGTPLPAAERAEFLDLWTPLVARIDALAKGLLLRDVIAANLVWIEGAEGVRRIGFLDVQDAMIGPEAYDLMALTTDVRLDLPMDLVAAMRGAWVERRRRADPTFDATTLASDLALLSAQRNSKILGGFARLAERDGKRGYLAHLPLVRRRVAEALADPVLASLRLWYQRRGYLD